MEVFFYFLNNNKDKNDTTINDLKSLLMKVLIYCCLTIH